MMARPMPDIPSGPDCSLAKTIANATVTIKNNVLVVDATDTVLKDSCLRILGYVF